MEFSDVTAPILYLVCERWRRLVKVELPEYDRKQQQHNAEQHGQPECGRRHQRRRCSHVRVVEQLRVDDEREHEVEDDAAPDDEMVETGPVRRVQCTLATDHTR